MLNKQKIAGLIVRAHLPLMILMILLAGLAAPNIARTRINYSLTDYLNDDTPTKRGLNIMNGEFEATSSLTLALPGEAGEGGGPEALADRLRGLPGVMTVQCGPQAEENGVRYTRVSVMTKEEAAQAVYDAAESWLADTPHLVSGPVRDNRIIRESLADEMPLIMLVAGAIVLAVLLIMSRSWLEPLIFALNIAVSVLLNMGTNFVFPSISFITFAVAAILQLALSMDYAIMLINAYDAALDGGLPARDAMREALANSFMPIFSSALTTVAGMISLVFMSFTIGYDIGMVLAKGILLSMLTVFLMMPGLLILLTGALRRTRHRQLRIRAGALAKMPKKARTAVCVCLLVLIAAGGILQTGNTYTYTVQDMDGDSARIAALFGRENQMVLLFPRCGDDESYALQAETLERIQALSIGGRPAVKAVYAMPVTGEAAIRYYDEQSAAELMNVPPELAHMAFQLLGIQGPVRGDALIRKALDSGPLAAALMPADLKQRLTETSELLSTAEATFNGENWSRAILTLDFGYLDPGGPETLRAIKRILGESYGDRWAVAGGMTATDDIAASFSGDIQRVSLITILAVFLIVLCSFRRIAVPAVLVCVIQGAVWINMAYSGLRDGSVFFMCYLICMALQMGATIDYGILMTSHYRAQRASLPPEEAAERALDLSVQTIFTSGLALIVAGSTVGAVSSLFYISSIGRMLGRGAAVSVLLVLLLLPQLLVWTDRFIVKETVNRK